MPERMPDWEAEREREREGEPQRERERDPDSRAGGFGRRRAAAVIVIAMLLGALGVSIALRRDAQHGRDGVVDARYPSFHAQDPLHADISAAPLDRRHPRMLANFLAQIRASKGAVGINTDHYAASYVRAEESTPTTDVRFVDCQRKGSAGQRMLDERRVFDEVPIPPDAEAARGTDGHLGIWRPATDQLWELWQAERDADGSWQACWGGRIDRVSQSFATFAPPFGVSASGLSATALMISVEEAKTGRIDHAIGLVLTDPGKGWSYPAARGDGTSTGPGAIPEGTRLRLDPALNLDTLTLTPFGRAVATAAQRYGFVVMDRGGAVVLLGQSGRIDQQRTGVDPWSEIFGEVPPYRQLDGIPWQRIQVIERDWGKPGEPPAAGSPGRPS